MSNVSHHDTKVKAIAAALRAVADALELEGTSPHIQVPAASPTLIDLPTAQDRTGIGRRTIVQAYRAGEIDGHDVGRKIMLSVASLDAWVASRKSRRTPATTTPSDPAARLRAAGLARASEVAELRRVAK